MKCPNCSIELSLIATGTANKASQGRETDIGALLNQIHDDELETDFEIEFIKSTRERFAQYGPRTRMSEKQMIALQKIAAK